MEVGQRNLPGARGAALRAFFPLGGDLGPSYKMWPRKPGDSMKADAVHKA